MAISKETEDVQNILGRLSRETVLNVQDSTPKIKKQFSKAMVYLEKARLEFDILNDMKLDLKRDRK